MSREHNCNFENISLMTIGLLKNILIAYQEEPDQIPEICEKNITKLKKTTGT